MSTQTIVRTIALVISTLNTLAVALGWNPLPWDEGTIYAALSSVVEVALIAWAWWKNNSVTKAAIAADEYLKTLKEGN